MEQVRVLVGGTAYGIPVPDGVSPNRVRETFERFTDLIGQDAAIRYANIALTRLPEERVGKEVSSAYWVDLEGGKGGVYLTESKTHQLYFRDYDNPVLMRLEGDGVYIALSPELAQRLEYSTQNDYLVGRFDLEAVGLEREEVRKAQAYEALLAYRLAGKDEEALRFRELTGTAPDEITARDEAQLRAAWREVRSRLEEAVEAETKDLSPNRLSLRELGEKHEEFRQEGTIRDETGIAIGAYTLKTKVLEGGTVVEVEISPKEIGGVSTRAEFSGREEKAFEEGLRSLSTMRSKLPD